MNAGRFISLPCESAGERRLISMLRPIAVVATVVALSAAPAQGEAADERTAPVGPTTRAPARPSGTCRTRVPSTPTTPCISSTGRTNVSRCSTTS